MATGENTQVRSAFRNSTFQVSMKILLLVPVRRAYLRRYSKYESLLPPKSKHETWLAAPKVIKRVTRNASIGKLTGGRVNKLRSKTYGIVSRDYENWHRSRMSVNLAKVFPGVPR
jgi:hypothetical protein